MAEIQSMQKFLSTIGMELCVSLLVQDSTVHAEEDYITEMKDQMQQMIDKEVELQSKIFAADNTWLRCK